ncbi:hypothetical protein RRF57_005319 [Xylaria bambusicola]|uniref:Uncharacterized protein n=1 Tax=Xylaria bambusicola TaxID=326684 RepID=A0AAN7UM20_9PEZI
MSRIVSHTYWQAPDQNRRVATTCWRGRDEFNKADASAGANNPPSRFRLAWSSMTATCQGIKCRRRTESFEDQSVANDSRDGQAWKGWIQF